MPPSPDKPSKPPLRLGRVRTHRSPGERKSRESGLGKHLAVAAGVAAVLAAGLVFDARRPNEPEEIVLTEPEETLRQVWFCPDLAVGPGLDTVVSIVNGDGEATTASVTFFPDDGDEVLVTSPDVGSVLEEDDTVDDTGGSDDETGDGEAGDTGETADVGAELGGAEPEPVDVEVPGAGQASVRASDHLAVSGALSVAAPSEGLAVTAKVVVPADEERPERGIATFPCADGAAESWYFAAGTTLRGVKQTLQLFNPTGEDATVDVTFAEAVAESATPQMIEPEETTGIVVPGGDRLIVEVDGVVPRASDVATIVRSESGQVVASQSLRRDAESGIAAQLGSLSSGEGMLPAVTLGEGADVVSLYNPADRSIDVNVVFHGAEGAAAIAPVIVELEAGAVQTLDFTKEAEGVSGTYGLAWQADTPVVVGQWRRSGTGEALVLPAPAVATSWWLPGVRSGAIGEIWLQNPGDSPSRVEIYAVPETPSDGEPEALPLEVIVPGLGIAGLDLSSLGLPAGTVALRVESEGEIAVAEELIEADDTGFMLGIPLG